MRYFATLVMVAGLTIGIPLQLEAQDFSLGLAGGAVTSSVGGSDVRLGNWTWGGTFGAIGSYRIARQAGLGFEVNWVQKGGDDVAFADFESQNLDLQYIEIPLTIGYVNQWSGWESGLYIGIQVGFQISCKVKGSQSGSSTDCDEALNVVSKKTTDWSLPFGFFFAKNLGGSSLGLDVRYALGLSDIFENTSIRNRAWLFRAIWYVPLGG